MTYTLQIHTGYRAQTMITATHSNANANANVSPRRESFYKLGLWNVRSCANDVKFKSIHKQLIEGRFRLVVLTETRMPSGSFSATGGWTMYNAGHGPNTPPNGGVGFLVDTNTFNVLSVREHSNRLASITVENDGVTFDIIGGYGPTECSENEVEKEHFYWLLDKTYKERKASCHKVIVMGDFNCRIGMDARAMYEGVVGPFTDQNPETSVNGMRVASFCEQNDLKILNTYYEKKQVLRPTWHHPP